jgi:hypothetical protein
VKLSDPTGHKCAGEEAECEDEDGNPINGVGGLTPKNNDNNPEPGNGDFCDPIVGCENPDTGIFCDQTSCWYDSSTDITWTIEDWPTISIPVIASCLLTGLCETIGGGALYTCLRVTPCARVVASTTGITVYRVWGGTSGPDGKSWTPIDPRTITNYAGQAGLPPGNTAQNLTVGAINSMTNVTITNASPILSNPGGLLEYFIENPQVQVIVQEIQSLIK